MTAEIIDLAARRRQRLVRVVRRPRPDSLDAHVLAWGPLLAGLELWSAAVMAAADMMTQERDR